MSDIAICVENLSKLYRIGEHSGGMCGPVVRNPVVLDKTERCAIPKPDGGET